MSLTRPFGDGSPSASDLAATLANPGASAPALNAALRTATPLRALINPNTFAFVGTSRIASRYLDPTKNNKGNNFWGNWLEGMLRLQEKPLKVLGHYASSGYRTDQFAPFVAQAIASGAANCIIDGFINNISKSLPATMTGSISGTTLTATNINGVIGLGGVLTGTGVTAGTTIVEQLTADVAGQIGGAGTYRVSTAQTVASATLTSTGYRCVDGPNNGLYVTTANVVAVSLSDLKFYIKQMNDAGMRVFYVWERGAAATANNVIGLYSDTNRLLADYIENGDDFRGPPNCVVLDPTAATMQTNIATMAMKTALTADGTHDNAAGSLALARAFFPKILPYLRDVSGHRLRAGYQKNVGLYGCNPNPLMSGSAAAGGTGNSGNVPTNFTAAQSGAVTAAYTIQATAADADGNTFGNEVKIDYTATGAGTVKLILSLDKTLFMPGDTIKGGLEVTVAAGATGLQGVFADLEWFPSTGGTSPKFDMFVSGIGTDPGGYSLALEPDPLVLGAYTGTPFTNLVVGITTSAAGSGSIVARKFWSERTPAAVPTV